MQINLKIDVDNATRYLNVVHKDQIPFAASKTLNALAYQISRETLPKKTDEVFEKGATQFTKKGFRFKKSSKKNLIATVFVDPLRLKYMSFMVQGGTRFPNKRAILVSTKYSTLTAQGNLPNKYVKRILGDKDKFFSGIPKGIKDDQDYAGIWERYGRYISSAKRSEDFKGDGRRIRMVAHYAGSGRYQPKFPFGEFTEGVVFSRNDGFAQRFRANLQRAMQSAK